MISLITRFFFLSFVFCRILCQNEKVSTVLVTGGGGFVGYHVVERLLRTTEFSVVSLGRSKNVSNSRLSELLTTYASRLRVVEHDLVDKFPSALKKEIGNVSHVIHLAALSNIRKCVEDPLLCVNANVLGTAQLLEYSRQLDLELFIYFSTCNMFTSASPGIFYTEDDTFRSPNPYAASKVGGEELALAFERTYDIPTVIVRTMAVFGKRQDSSKFLTVVLRNVLEQKVVKILADRTGNIPLSRIYVDVEDVAEGLLFLMDRNWKSGEKYHLVGDTEMNLLQLAELVASFTGDPLKSKLVSSNNSARFLVSGEKMNRIGWKPKKLEVRVKEFVEWTMKNQRWL